MQAQLQIKKDPIKTLLQTRLKESSYLEDAYFVYLKQPARSYLDELEQLTEEPEVFYWYAFTFAGHNKLYNIVWGTFVDGVVTIDNGCTYRIDNKAKLSILNAVKKTRKENDFFYLGGGVRDRIAETMNQYLLPGHQLPGILGTSRANADKNRVDLNLEFLKDSPGTPNLSKESQVNPNLPPELLSFILDKIIDAIEHSDISNRAIPQPCPTLEECINRATELCQLYHQGFDERDLR